MLNSNGILLQDFHKEFQSTGPKDFGFISGGETQLYAKLNGKGLTYRDLVKSLDGQVIAIINPSIMQTGALSFLSGNLITEILKTIDYKNKSSSKIDLNCAVIRADFNDGNVDFPQGIAFSSKQLSLVSDGNLNLINDKLNFSMQPFSGSVVDLNVAQALTSLFKIKGTLQEPRITIDDKQALKTIVGIAATGGTAYLGTKVLEGAESPCYTALQGTKYANKFPKPTGLTATTKEVYQDTTKALEQEVDIWKNNMKKLFNTLK